MNQRAIWLIDGREGYGVARAILTLVTELRQNQNWSITLASVGPGAFADQCINSGLDVRLLSTANPSDFSGRFWARTRATLESLKQQSAARALSKLAREQGAQLIHVLRPNLVALAGQAASEVGIRCFWEMPNYIRNRTIPVNRWYYQAVCAHYNITPLANSQYTASTLGHFPIRPVTFHLGADDLYFSPDASFVKLTRSDLDIPESASLFSIVARMVPSKGQELFCRAILALKDEHPDLHLLLVGGPLDDYANRIRDLSSGHSYPTLTIIGPTDDPRPYYSLSDVVVNSRTDAEPFGLSIVEAMMMAKPVLAHGLGGPSEIINDSSTGWLIPEPSLEAYVNGIRRALLQRSTWSMMGTRARAVAETRFSARSQASRYIEQTMCNTGGHSV